MWYPQEKESVVNEAMSDGEGVGDVAFIKKRRMRCAALIKKVYEVDPLQCPECGGKMKIIRFIEKCQPEAVEKILRHCGLWKEEVPRPPPVVSRVAEGESSYDYGCFERLCI